LLDSRRDEGKTERALIGSRADFRRFDGVRTHEAQRVAASVRIEILLIDRDEEFLEVVLADQEPDKASVHVDKHVPYDVGLHRQHFQCQDRIGFRHRHAELQRGLGSFHPGDVRFGSAPTSPCPVAEISTGAECHSTVPSRYFCHVFVFLN
jgi:hypothetical protein